MMANTRELAFERFSLPAEGVLVTDVDDRNQGRYFYVQPNTVGELVLFRIVDRYISSESMMSQRIGRVPVNKIIPLRNVGNLES